jgi:AcrR family transcriptional regulator
VNAPQPYAVAARELLRDTLLDAALAELAQRPWAEVTMARIATGAGVSRQTLYNEFGSRDEFAQALILREAERFSDAVEQVLNAHRDDPQKALGAAAELFLTAAQRNALVRAVASGGADEMLALVTTQGRPVVEFASERLSDAIYERWPQAGRPACELLAENLVRLAISHVALPSGTPEETADAITALLGPYVERVLPGG